MVSGTEEAKEQNATEERDGDKDETEEAEEEEEEQENAAVVIRGSCCEAIVVVLTASTLSAFCVCSLAVSIPKLAFVIDLSGGTFWFDRGMRERGY